jgi:hypothetical protein
VKQVFAKINQDMAIDVAAIQSLRVSDSEQTRMFNWNTLSAQLDVSQISLRKSEL